MAHLSGCSYKALHGTFVVHPVNGRRIPIICDAELVDMSFGTGAVKVRAAGTHTHTHMAGHGGMHTLPVTACS